MTDDQNRPGQRIVRIPFEFLGDILNVNAPSFMSAGAPRAEVKDNELWMVRCNNWPKDARVVECAVDFQANVLMVKIEAPEFKRDLAGSSIMNYDLHYSRVRVREMTAEECVASTAMQSGGKVVTPSECMPGITCPVCSGPVKYLEAGRYGRTCSQKCEREFCGLKPKLELEPVGKDGPDIKPINDLTYFPKPGDTISYDTYTLKVTGNVVRLNPAPATEAYCPACGGEHGEHRIGCKERV